jgi:hypothetical protein
MIGVIANISESKIVSEFFELFKTPWEFFDRNKAYDVVINATENYEKTNAKLVLIFASTNHASDNTHNITAHPIEENKYLLFEGQTFPVYVNLSAISGQGTPRLPIGNSAFYAGLESKDRDQVTIRIGYDLFQEVAWLLGRGQPPQYASIPTLEIHIDILRQLMLKAGIAFVEIPPVPNGYNFMVCLTHDIDFIRIRDHKFDHTMFGFLYRATLGTLLDVLKSKRTWKELYQNWTAALKLPLVYLGIVADFWFKFDRYMELENRVHAKSTFFMIPFKNRAGDKLSESGAYRRASKYDVTDIPETINTLVKQGFEVGVHGLDAWHDVTAALAEKLRIENISGQSNTGIRMHWLCFDQNTQRILDEAGFAYDTTFGYNDAVGYRAGTSQAFKPLNAERLLELPLNIQDTALFNPKHMSLLKEDAWKRCEDLVEKTSRHGGALTVLWHDRSLSPERLYEDFYIRLLDELQRRKAWFATAADICQWFQARRHARFEKGDTRGDKIRVRLQTDTADRYPPLQLRIYRPAKKKVLDDTLTNRWRQNYVEIPWPNEPEISLSL